MPIRGSVHLVRLVFVIQTPPVLRLHLTCVPVTRPAATGVNVIQDTPEMDSTAQVSNYWPLMRTNDETFIVKCVAIKF